MKPRRPSDTAQPAAPAITTPDGSANLTPGEAHDPPRATGGSARPGSPPPPPPSALALPGQPRSSAARTIFLTFKDLVGKSVYNSITAVEFLVSLSLKTVLADYDINVC